MTSQRPTALIADDEPLLRDSLERLLGQAWPELQVVAQARNGREAIEQFEKHRPDICFLDVHMPGTTGVEVARQIGRRAHLVFVTAYDKYAVQAFSHGVLDYLVKPVEPARVAETVARLKERLHAAEPAHNIEALLQQHAAQGARDSARCGTVRAGAPLGGGQPALDCSRRAQPQRDRRHPPQGARRSAAGEPQLSASVSPDVTPPARRASRATT